MKKENDGPPEPLGSMMELVDEYGTLVIVATVREIARFDAEEDSCCVSCCRKNQWWSKELGELLARYKVEFPEILDAKLRINAEGPRLVQ